MVIQMINVKVCKKYGHTSLFTEKHVITMSLNKEIIGGNNGFIHDKDKVKDEESSRQLKEKYVNLFISSIDCEKHNQKHRNH